jgi:hypothetical protein
MNFGRTLIMDEKMHHSWTLHPKTTHTQIKVFVSPFHSHTINQGSKYHKNTFTRYRSQITNNEIQIGSKKIEHNKFVKLEIFIYHNPSCPFEAQNLTYE